MPNQVELVAQAFYAAEFSGDWEDAPEILQEQFRDLARTAITLLHQQISQCRLSPTFATFSEASRERAAVQLPS